MINMYVLTAQGPYGEWFSVAGVYSTYEKAEANQPADSDQAIYNIFSKPLDAEADED